MGPVVLRALAVACANSAGGPRLPRGEAKRNALAIDARKFLARVGAHGQGLLWSICGDPISRAGVALFTAAVTPGTLCTSYWDCTRDHAYSFARATSGRKSSGYGLVAALRARWVGAAHPVYRRAKFIVIEFKAELVLLSPVDQSLGGNPDLGGGDRTAL